MQSFLGAKFLLAFSLIALGSFTNSVESVTLQEFKHTLKIVHDVCQTITKISEDQITQVRDGNYNDDGTVKCLYVHCQLEMLHLIDGTSGQFHVAGQHTDYMIPNELFDTTIKAFGHCEDSTKGITDNCEAAYAMIKCFRENNDSFWLP